MVPSQLQARMITNVPCPLQSVGQISGFLGPFPWRNSQAQMAGSMSYTPQLLINQDLWIISRFTCLLCVEAHQFFICAKTFGRLRYQKESKTQQ